MNSHHKIHIIGLGVAEHAVLSCAAQEALLSCDVIMGSERQLQSVAHLLVANKSTPNGHRVHMLLPKLSTLKACFDELKGKQICVLASGDPLFYGIGRWFSREFTADSLTSENTSKELVFHPAISSIQAACHKQGMSLQDVEVLSLHGRPLEKIRTKLTANTQLLILTDKHSHPVALAQECVAAGFAASRLTVCENLGYASEKIQTYAVDDLLASTDVSFSDLNIVIIDVKGLGKFLPVFPGIPDEHYITGAEPGKGMISKREVRLMILSYLQVGNDDVVWDIGAGCGGVAIELAYWNERARVHAIECNSERAGYLALNSARFGVGSNLHIHEGRAPVCFIDCPAPNKVFIGGSDGVLDVLLRDVWQRLPVHGVLVVSSVVEKSKLCVKQFIHELHVNDLGKEQQSYHVESTELLVKRGMETTEKSKEQKIKEQKIHEEYSGTDVLTYRAKLPVEIFKFVKGE